MIFVRGDPEYLSYAILPGVLYFFSKIFSAKSDRQFFLNAFFAAVTGGLLTISHNVVSVFVMPIILVYLLAKIYVNKEIGLKRMGIIFISFLSSFGIGAFFVFPAFLEMRFTQIATPIFNYKDHFPVFMQLLNSKWGYGDSAIGTTLDGLSFQLGYAHWVILSLVGIWFLYNLFSKKINLKWFIDNLLTLIFIIISLASIYLMLSVSIPVWEATGLSRVLDFPWRILGVAVFSISALFGIWVSTIKSKEISLIIIASIVFLAVFGNRNHLLAQPVLESDLPFYVSLDSFSAERNSIPAFAENIFPPDAKILCSPKTPVVSTDVNSDKIASNELERGSTFGSIDLTINKEVIQGNKIIFDISYFPGLFNFFINGQKIGYSNCGGLACVNILDFKDGGNLISWKIVQTPTEKIFNWVSLVFITGWICTIICVLFKNENKKSF